MNDFWLCSILRMILRGEILSQWHFFYLRFHVNWVLCGERQVPNCQSHPVFYIITNLTTLNLVSHNFHIIFSLPVSWTSFLIQNESTCTAWPKFIRWLFIEQLWTFALKSRFFRLFASINMMMNRWHLMLFEQVVSTPASCLGGVMFKCWFISSHSDWGFL